MQKKKIKNNRGITLIALVITIIILLILAGVTLGLVTGNNGILGRAEDASRISEIKTIEEFAKLSYMDRQINEVMTGKEATIAGVISDLKAEGYTIKQEAGAGNNLTGIALSENNVVLSRNGEKTITYTLVYAQGETVRYFVEVQGKYYEIEFNDGNITVNTEEAKMGETKEPEIAVESSNNSIIEAKKTEEGKILLTAKGEVGDVEITVREVNSNVTNTITATTKTAVTGVSISPTEITIKIGETANLTAIIEPSDATNQAVTWSSSDESIATVTEEGVVTRISAGKETVTITATTADGNKTAQCIVNNPYIHVGEYLVDVVEIGTYVSGGTVNGGNWRVLSKSGSGVNGVVKLVSANSTLTYYHAFGNSAASIQALQDLTEEYASWKNINYVDQTKGCHAFGCSTHHMTSTGTKATGYSPLNEVETLYQEITGISKTMDDLFNSNATLSDSELQTAAGAKWKSIYAGLICNGATGWFGGASHDADYLWYIYDSGRVGISSNGTSTIRPVVSLQSGVKVSNTNLGDGTSADKAYTLTK